MNLRLTTLLRCKIVKKVTYSPHIFFQNQFFQIEINANPYTLSHYDYKKRTPESVLFTFYPIYLGIKTVSITWITPLD